MIGIKYILSKYNLKAIIALVLPIWLEKLYFLLSLQPSPISATRLAVQELYNKATNSLFWEEILHAHGLTQVSRCRTCGRASDPWVVHRKQRPGLKVLYLLLFPKLPLMLVCS